MSVKSKVVRIEFVKTRPSQYGDMDDYSVEFENGQTGEVTVKHGNRPPWAVGEDAEFDVKPSPGNYPAKIKKATTPFAQGGGSGGGGGRGKTWETERMIIPSMATSVACNGVCSLIAAGKLEPEKLRVAVDVLAKALAKTMQEIAGDMKL